MIEQHIACAAFEHPLSLLYDERYFGSGLDCAIRTLVSKGLLVSDPSCVSQIWSYDGHEVRYQCTCNQSSNFSEQCQHS